MFLTWLSYYEVEGMMVELQSTKDAIVKLKDYYPLFIHKETYSCVYGHKSEYFWRGVGTLSAVCGNQTGYFKV